MARRRIIVPLVCLLFAVQALVPVPAAARPAKLEINNGLGISLFLIGSALFGTVVAFSPKQKRGELPEEEKPEADKTAKAPVKTAEEMKQELLDMRRK